MVGYRGLEPLADLSPRSGGRQGKGNPKRKSARHPVGYLTLETLAEGAGFEPVTFRLARFSRPVTHHLRATLRKTGSGTSEPLP
jgi:hypothetical protein